MQGTLFAVIACLAVAARFPLTSWRIAYLTVLFGPLLRAWLPRVSQWDPAVVVVVAIVFCVAGYRLPRAALWWMAAFMLIPVWVWAAPDWVDRGELSATLIVLLWRWMQRARGTGPGEPSRRRPNGPSWRAPAGPCLRSGRGSPGRCTTW